MRTAQIVLLLMGKAFPRTLPSWQGHLRRSDLAAAVDDALRYRYRLNAEVERHTAGVPTRTVYIELLDEGVDVWRPVDAEVEDGDLMLLPPEAPSGERWAFPPGSLVRCETRDLGLVAVEAV